MPPLRYHFQIYGPNCNIFTAPTILFYNLKLKLMAGPGQNAFLATLYGQVAYVDNLTGGIGLYGNGYSGPVYESLPVAGTKVSSIPYTIFQTKFGTVYANSLIEVFPMGLQIPAKSKVYICDSTVTTLNTNRL
jgi:hypothetical protein